MDRRWEGKTVVCIASGPSLTAEDCALVEQTGLPTIAVNSSWKIARFADIVYAGDPGWWTNYGSEIDIPAERWTCAGSIARHLKIHHHRIGGSYNSGSRAVQLAIDLGAARVLLLGYDASVKRGTHWHGEHTKTRNPDEARCMKWHKHFAAIDRKGVEVINCSRETELTCFPRMNLEDVICLRS